MAHWWDDVDADFRKFQDQHPDDDRGLVEVAEAGDWQRWYDGGCVPLHG
jgi:hypothetical protein